MWGRSHPFFSFTLGRAILPNDAGMPSSRWGWSKTNLARQECRHSPGQGELSFFFLLFLVWQNEARSFPAWAGSRFSIIRPPQVPLASPQLELTPGGRPTIIILGRGGRSPIGVRTRHSQLRGSKDRTFVGWPAWPAPERRNEGTQGAGRCSVTAQLAFLSCECVCIVCVCVFSRENRRSLLLAFEGARVRTESGVKASGDRAVRGRDGEEIGRFALANFVALALHIP